MPICIFEFGAIPLFVFVGLVQHLACGTSVLSVSEDHCIIHLILASNESFVGAERKEPREGKASSSETQASTN